LEDFIVSATLTPLLSDSIGAINIARDPMKDELTKNIGVDASIVRIDVHDHDLTLLYVPSKNLADFFHKGPY
jgi:hypothetical protein